MIYTTLNEIKKFAPCESGWKTLLKYLSKKAPDDEPLPLSEILKANGLNDALWATRCVWETHKKEMILMTLKIARTVQHLMKDERSLKALDVVYRYANGDATEEELRVARGDALAARRDAYAADAAAAAYAAAADAAAAAYAAAAAADADAAYAADAAAADAADAAAYAAYAADAAAARAQKRKEIEAIFLEVVG